MIYHFIEIQVKLLFLYISRIRDALRIITAFQYLQTTNCSFYILFAYLVH